MAQYPRSPDDGAATDQAREAEQHTLGGLLLDPARYAEIRRFLTPEDFIDPLNLAIFQAMGELADAGRPVDPFLVADILLRERHDEFSSQDVRAYLGSLATQIPSAANVLHYAQLVRERAIDRRDRATQRGGVRVAYEERNDRLYAPDGRMVIRWIDGKLPEIVDQAEAALIDADVGIYQRDRMLVRVLKRAEPSIRNYKRAPGVLGIQMVTAPYLVETLTRAALWEKWDGRSERWRPINAHEKVASTYIERAGQWNVPRLWDTISAPTLRPDGTILQTPGYDAATCVYYDPCGIEFPRIKDQPDREDAVAAYRLLAEAYGSFPYGTDVDRSVALAAALTALVRRSLPSAPMVAISAPMPNSGKTLLADGIAILGMGSTAPVMTFAETDEEAKKTALAVLVEGDPVVLIDNVERPLSGDWLCSILTAEIYRQRVLGRTEMISVPTRMLMLATGNHIQVAGDLRSRTLLCRIDAKMERPGERVFREDFRRKLIERRPELVAAGLTLMRAFIATGQRIEDFVKPWGRFERWSDLVRAPLVWMEAADPCDSINTLEAEDPQRGEHLRLLSLWSRAFGDRDMTARHVIEHLNVPNRTETENELWKMLRDIALDRNHQDLSSKRLGRWLERHQLQLVAGYQIERAGVEDNSALWRVVRKVH